MNPLKLAVIGLAAVSLSACLTTNQNVPEINTNKPAPVVVPVVAPMDLQSVQWTVRDVEGLKALIAQMEATGQTNVVFYVLTQDQYDALAMNLAEVKRYVNDQKAANDFLKAAIDTNATPAEKPTPEKPKQEEKPRKKVFGIF